MIDTFIPLSPARLSGVTIPAGTASASGRASAEATPKVAKSAASTFGAFKPCGRGEPAVSLLRDGEKVTGVHIECSCGQVIELAFTIP